MKMWGIWLNYSVRRMTSPSTGYRNILVTSDTVIIE